MQKIFYQALKIVVLSFLIISCGTTKKYYRADFENLNQSIDGEFYNYQENKFTKDSSNQKITNLFGIKTNDSIVKLKTVGDNLVVSYKDENGKLKHNSYPGDFTKKYFKVYFEYKTNTYPLFISKSMDYLRFSILKDNSLVIYQESTNEGFFLVMVAGNSYTNELLFKSKNK